MELTIATLLVVLVALVCLCYALNRERNKHQATTDRLNDFSHLLERERDINSELRRQLHRSKTTPSDADSWELDVDFMLERMVKDSKGGLTIVAAEGQFEISANGHLWLTGDQDGNKHCSGWHDGLPTAVQVLFARSEHYKAVARQYQYVDYKAPPPDTVAETVTCDRGHAFAKLPGHPRRDGFPRCPNCMAEGLDAFLRDRTS